MESFRKWIRKYITLIQLLLILGFIIMSLAFHFIASTEKLMITLITFLCVDCFVVSIGYLDQIMIYIKQEDKELLTPLVDIKIADYIKKAKYNIFISGSTLSSLSDRAIREQFDKLDKKIKLELYNTDSGYMSNNPELYNIINATQQQFNNRWTTFETDVLPCFEKRDNTCIASVKAVFPITYIGIDTEKSFKFNNSVIIGMHYTFGKSNDIAWIAKPGSELYNKYRKQIEEIRNIKDKNIIMDTTKKDNDNDGTD